MKEIAEFRVDEDFASELFADDEGERLGTMARKVELATDDPRFRRVGELNKEKAAELNRAFFYSWDIRRTYTKAEREAASLLLVEVASVFEPAGEERGTEYDESAACPGCGSGAEQTGPLILDVRRIPKRKDFAATIAGEIVVSRRAVELFERDGVSGVNLGPVHVNRKGQKSEDWFQLTLRSTEAEIVPPTHVGINPFDDDPEGEYRCSQGDLIGLNLLSEVSISAASRGDDDFVGSRQFIGMRMGLLRPQHEIFVSPKVWKLIECEKLKGIKIEVTHVI
ncbi:MAG: hypothetical protein HQ559_01900 [Lentisphaerae bacterium]|nr:hypothetical protein [Lentisphaerota bacterium]